MSTSMFVRKKKLDDLVWVNNSEFGRLNRLKWVLSIILESKAIPTLYNK